MSSVVRKRLSITTLIIMVIGALISSPITAWAFTQLNQMEPLKQSVNRFMLQSDSVHKDINTQLGEIVLLLHETHITMADGKARLSEVEQECDKNRQYIRACEIERYNKGN